VSMRIPNLFVIEFVSINAHSSSSVLISNITTLCHEALNNSMEEITFIVWTFLSSTDCSEIFSCLGNLFCEKLKNNSFFLFLIFRISNLNVKENLRIFWVEGWKFIKSIFNFYFFFFIVNTLSKEFLHCCLLGLTMLLFFIFQVLKIFSEFFILRTKFNCILNVI